MLNWNKMKQKLCLLPMTMEYLLIFMKTLHTSQKYGGWKVWKQKLNASFSKTMNSMRQKRMDVSCLVTKLSMGWLSLPLKWWKMLWMMSKMIFPTKTMKPKNFILFLTQGKETDTKHQGKKTDTKHLGKVTGILIPHKTGILIKKTDT